VFREVFLDHRSLADEVQSLVHPDHRVEEGFHPALGILPRPSAAEVVDGIDCPLDVEVLDLELHHRARDAGEEAVAAIDEGNLPANLRGQLDLRQATADDLALDFLSQPLGVLLVGVEEAQHEFRSTHRLLLEVAAWPGIEPESPDLKSGALAP
jgi:hypothetical protein